MLLSSTVASGDHHLCLLGQIEESRQPSDVAVLAEFDVDWVEYEQEGHEILAERLAGWQEQYPDVSVRRRIVCDRAAHWLIDEAARAQLVVLGSRGRGGFTRMLLGSVSTAVAESSMTPVIVVRS